MPILPPEPDVFPPDLLTADHPDEGSGRHWWALYTMARREKELMRRLRAMGIAHYSPQVKKRSRSPQGRLRESMIPLFSNYVFLYGDDEARRTALTTNCISRTLEVPDTETMFHDLRQIQMLIASEAPILPESRLEAGTPVRIRSGPFKGLEGVIIKRRGEQRLLVAVQFLQQGASVMLEDFQVEQI